MNQIVAAPEVSGAVPLPVRPTALVKSLPERAHLRNTLSQHTLERYIAAVVDASETGQYTMGEAVGAAAQNLSITAVSLQLTFYQYVTPEARKYCRSRCIVRPRPTAKGIAEQARINGGSRPQATPWQVAEPLRHLLVVWVNDAQRHGRVKLPAACQEVAEQHGLKWQEVHITYCRLKVEKLMDPKGYRYRAA